MLPPLHKCVEEREKTGGGLHEPALSREWNSLVLIDARDAGRETGPAARGGARAPQKMEISAPGREGAAFLSLIRGD